ncbi:CheR family methyltransferase [Thiocystis violascens]|uniref:Chemotaxis protein methyltransferase n=1 Tax=Thiocystis violascens (strain ATCC 17096 / DSM 198 / 6111) TaxID=765911 RepID=I3YG22_THIV6|nr:protein-glutamate O-methyltransferase CheR [Thiocystis violascens]AFL75940.1 methylase of chemotaxis methyl-accepting protein [Thiocystis violascens DSM 198]
MHTSSLSDLEFAHFRKFIHGIAGIHLGPAKKTLVAGRLAKRLRFHGLASFGDYYRLLSADPDERQIAVDLLTTNETYFFREPRHFELLRERLLPKHPPGQMFRVWSAACSSGEEVYTLAMVLADALGEAPWEVLGSDLSTRVLEQADSGLYSLERTAGLSGDHLRRYCLKGIGSQEGRFVVSSLLRAQVRFAQINLTEPLPAIGMFDAIFLRNVMIYFQPETKRQVVERLLTRLRPGGWLFVGHSESLHGLANGLEGVAPSVYRKA